MAFHSIPPEEQGRRQMEVYEAIRTSRTPICDRAIVRKLNRLINCITPRRNELVKKGVVREAYTKKYPTSDPEAHEAIHGEVW